MDSVNVLFLTNSKLGHMESQGIFTDLLRQFVSNGHSVCAVCANERRLGRKTELTRESGINVLRVRTGNVTQVNMIEKGISILLIEHQFRAAVKDHFSDISFDLVLYSTPPITLAGVIEFIKDRDNARAYLMLKDIFPQNAVDMEVMRFNGLIHRYFRRIEKKFYQLSDFIGCMSQRNVDYILAHNPEIPSEKVEVCPTSIDPVAIEKNDTIIRDIRRKYDIPVDKTVFIYGGNLGKPQGLDYLIECIKSSVMNRQAFFLIVGSGTDYVKLERYFSSNRPTNARLLFALPKSDYEVLANSCDVGLVFLDRRFTIPNFPSRILSYMQASMPVLAATDGNTDLGDIIVEGDFGYWCESGDIEAFNHGVYKLCDRHLRKQAGANARQFLEDHYTAQHSYEIISSHF